jgi:hypothetical protein
MKVVCISPVSDLLIGEKYDAVLMSSFGKWEYNIVLINDTLYNCENFMKLEDYRIEKLKELGI